MTQNPTQIKILRLELLRERLINHVLQSEARTREGLVLTVGPPAYRRIDCDGRAFAYIRLRPRKHALRIDITGAWNTPSATELRRASAGGAAALLVQDEHQCEQALWFIKQTITQTPHAMLPTHRTTVDIGPR